VKERVRCEICGKCFCSKFTLKRHYPTHDGQYQFTCPTCGLGFVGKYYLDTHIKAKHSTGKSYQCSACYKCFGYKSNLNAHMKKFHINNGISEAAGMDYWQSLVNLLHVLFVICSALCYLQGSIFSVSSSFPSFGFRLLTI